MSERDCIFPEYSGVDRCTVKPLGSHAVQLCCEGVSQKAGVFVLPKIISFDSGRETTDQQKGIVAGLRSRRILDEDNECDPDPERVDILRPLEG